MYYTPQYGDPDGFAMEQVSPEPSMMPGSAGQPGYPMTSEPPGAQMMPGPSGPPMPLRQPGQPMIPGQRPQRPLMPSGRPDIRLINDIKEAVIREVHAYDYYTRLAAMARDEQDRQTILKIRHDEMKHYRWFTAILQRLGTGQPEIPQGPSPRSFEEGVRQSIRDELDAAAFYQNIAYRVRDRSIEMHFLHAAQDEQRHAAWFQSMLSAPQPVPYR